MCGGKIKEVADSTADKVKKGAAQLDPTTKEGLINLGTLGFGTAGANKSAGEKTGVIPPKEGSKGGTASERAAADVAIKEYDFARDMDFVKDEYAKRVERLGTKQMQNAVSGRANVDAQNQVSTLAGNTMKSLNQSGVDPSSGRATSTMTEVDSVSGDAIGNAKSQSQFALDNSHLEGKNNRIAMAMGEKTKAVAGLQDIAAGANNLAINKVNNKFNNNAANAQAIGTAVGMGSQAYLGRDKEEG